MYLLFRTLQIVMSSLFTCLLIYLILVYTHGLSLMLQYFIAQISVAFGETIPDCGDITLAL
jgi:hypothetical protein